MTELLAVSHHLLTDMHLKSQFTMVKGQKTTRQSSIIKLSAKMMFVSPIFTAVLRPVAKLFDSPLFLLIPPHFSFS
jgi:hypothetical protein